MSVCHTNFIIYFSQLILLMKKFSKVNYCNKKKFNNDKSDTMFEQWCLF